MQRNCSPVFLALGVSLCFVQSAQSAGAPKWNIEKVDRSANGNRQIALKLTNDGQIHLVYTGCSDDKCKNDELFYSVRDAAGKWSSTVVDSDKKSTGWFPSMLIDSSGTMHLVYSNHYKYPTLQYAFRRQGEKDWHKETVGKSPGGYWNSIAQSGSDLYIANTVFPKSNVNSPALQVATQTRAGWSFEQLDDSQEAGWFPSTVIDKQGLPAVTYVRGAYPNGDLILTRKQADGKWETVTLDDEAIKNSLAIDSRGFLHVAYTKMDPKFMKTKDLMYATNASDGNWKTMKLEGGEYPQQDTGFFPHLTIDAQDGLHIAYSDGFHKKLMYARNLGSGWEISQITKNNSDGYYAWLEIDTKGGVHIAYDTGDQIRYAYCADCAKH